MPVHTTLVHLITRLSLGGSTLNTIDSAAACARAGYRTILATGSVTSEVDVRDLAERTGCDIRVIPALSREPSPIRDVVALAQIARLLRTERVEILHTHTSKAGFLGRLAAYRVGVPVVIHTSHGHIFWGYYGKALTKFFILLERFAARLSDYLVFLTDGESREHLARRIGRPGQHLVIPSGVDLDSLRARAPSREAARRELGLEAETRAIVGVGRLVPIKGFDVLVRALPEIARDHPGTRLFLVGDGPERTALERLAAELSVTGALTITGARDDVSLYLAAAEVLVAPSRNEGQGRVLVEAMSLGLPVVGTSVSGIPDVLKDGACGLLVPPDRPQAIATAVSSLFDDDDRRLRLGELARRQAERFSLSIMEAGLLTLYRVAALEKESPAVGGKILEPPFIDV